jgi:kynurenine formamidase
MMIDCSGSMGFYSDDVEEIVNLLPASWIAGYVGYHGKHDGYDGDIRIIADNGSMSKSAIEKLNQHGANSVDFEALKLLAEQPEPRIWVSDQQVIGVNEENGRATTLSHERVKEIERFMLKNNIIPIENVDMVKEVAKQLSVKK